MYVKAKVMMGGYRYGAWLFLVETSSKALLTATTADFTLCYLLQIP